MRKFKGMKLVKTETLRTLVSVFMIYLKRSNFPAFSYSCHGEVLESPCRKHLYEDTSQSMQASRRAWTLECQGMGSKKVGKVREWDPKRSGKSGNGINKRLGSEKGLEYHMNNVGKWKKYINQVKY